MNSLFKQYPNLQVYFETSDGTQFYKEETAKTHAKSLQDKEVKTVKRSSVKEEVKNEEVKETAKEIIAKSVEMDLETVQKYLKAENELEAPRKTVLEALTARISELENAG